MYKWHPFCPTLGLKYLGALRGGGGKLFLESSSVLGYSPVPWAVISRVFQVSANGDGSGI